MRSISGAFATGRAAVGLLVLRLVFGCALMLHGLPKAQHPFNWMDKMPNHPPGIFQALAALSEFGGGLAFVLGLLTPLAALGVICTMGVAILTAHHGQPWISTNPKEHPFEAASLYLAVALALLIAGPGVHSLDAKLFGRKR